MLILIWAKSFNAPCLCVTPRSLEIFWEWQFPHSKPTFPSNCNSPPSETEIRWKKSSRQNTQDLYVLMRPLFPSDLSFRQKRTQIFWNYDQIETFSSNFKVFWCLSQVVVPNSASAGVSVNVEAVSWAIWRVCEWVRARIQLNEGHCHQPILRHC